MIPVFNKIPINEGISMANAYARFYAGKIPENVWAALTEGVPSMTPFHRKVIDVMLTNKMDENSQMFLAQRVNQAWKLGPEADKLLLKDANEGKIQTVEGLIDVLSTIETRAGSTISRVENDGLVKLYEDDDLLITCTTSYSASRKHYADTHWCTASGVDGVIDGFKQFISYTIETWMGDAVLLQFVDKHDRTASCQAEVSVENGELIVICNYNDVEISEENFIMSMNESYGIDIEELISSFDLEGLFNKTAENIEKEYDYWTEMEEKFHDKSRAEFLECVQSEKFFDFVKALAMQTDADYHGIDNSYGRNELVECFIRKSTLGCKNIILEVNFNGYITQSPATEGFMTKNAFAFATRMVSEDESCDDYSMTDGHFIFLCNPDFSLIKMFKAQFVEVIGNVCFASLGDAESEDIEGTIIINMNNGEIIYQSGDWAELQSSHVNNNIMTVVWYGSFENDPVCDINIVTGELVRDYEKEKQVNESVIRINGGDIMEMVVNCLKKLLK